MNPRIYTAPLCLALLLGACSSAEDAPRPNPAAQQLNTANPIPPQDGEGALDHDGSLRPARQEVFKAPLPMASKSVAVGGGWAGYQNEHSYGEVTSFYRKKLGEEYKAVQGKGGTRFSSPDGKTDIYIPKPRELGAPVRVFYFNNDPQAGPAPVLGDSRRAGATAGAGDSGATGAPPAANSPSRSAGTGTNPGAGGAGGAGGGAADSSYRKEVTTDAKGRRVIVYTPRPDAPAPAGENGAGRRAPQEDGSYRSYKVDIPPDFPD